MSRGLNLDQFKEPAFSSEILKIEPKIVYINSLYNMSDEKDFKFLFAQEDKIKKNELIAFKLTDDSTYKSLKIYSHQNYIVKETKYLINEKDKASSFVTLEIDDKLKSVNQDFNYDDDQFQNKQCENKSIEQLIDLSYQASIIDETDGEYIFNKLRKLKDIFKNGRLYIDAIDDQPFTSSKESILLHYPNAINFVIKTIKHIFKTDNIDIIFYDNEDYNREIKMPKKCVETDIIGVKGNYPIRHFINKNLNYDSSIGVQAILHLARVLLNNNYKQTTTFITVAGNAIAQPRNIEVPIGTSTKEIIENFNLKSQPKRIVLGQVISGVAISEDETPISVMTRSILIFSDYVILKQMECIGCSKCADVCPQNLLPSYRNKFKETGDISYEEFSSEAKCLKCYCCTYICPSHINLV